MSINLGSQLPKPDVPMPQQNQAGQQGAQQTSAQFSETFQKVAFYGAQAVNAMEESHRQQRKQRKTDDPISTVTHTEDENKLLLKDFQKIKASLKQIVEAERRYLDI